jgi:Fe-S cluster biogenesis protein NfuA
MDSISHAPYLTDEGLDELYEKHPVAAMRLSRGQVEIAREMHSAAALDPSLPAPTPDAINALLDKARSILQRDGGDLKLMALDGDVVAVRMTGSCARSLCSALDVKRIVERVIEDQFRQLTVVRRDA